MHEELEYKTVEMMERYGGSFVRQLGTLMRFADYKNFNKLKEAFPEYWDKYHKMALEDDN